MNKEIDLKSIVSQGDVVKKLTKEDLQFTTTSRLSTRFNKNMPLESYITTNKLYKLPLQINITLKIDSSGFYLMLGNGHLSFGTPWQDNRRVSDIVEPKYKPKFFDNYIPINEFVNISVYYGLKEMQIKVNNEVRYYSKKERYMKSKFFNELNLKGLKLKLTCDKRSTTHIKTLNITELKEDKHIEQVDNLPPAVTVNQAVKDIIKPSLKECISLLPIHIQNKIIEIDSFLLSLKPLKFKRKVVKQGKITYIATKHGFSYSIYPSNDIMHHSLNWYIITNRKPEQWRRKADLMETTLRKLNEKSTELANRMFLNLRECILCNNHCAVKTLYQFEGVSKLTCHGIMDLKMFESDFDDAISFMDTVNNIIKDI